MFTLNRMLKAKNEAKNEVKSEVDIAKRETNNNLSLANDPLHPNATPLDNLPQIDTSGKSKERLVFYAGAGIITIITYLAYKRPKI